MGKYINSLLLLLFMGVCFAIPPGPISYQAVLKDALGEPIVGTHLINFYLYDVDTGGSYLWMEGHNIDIDSSGVYNALLGSVTRFPDSVDFSKDYWLGITVDRGAELVPRYKLTASPYAYYARDISSMGATDGQLIKWSDSLSKWIPSKDDTGRVSWDTLSAYYDTTSLQFPGGSRVSWWNLINIPFDIDSIDDTGFVRLRVGSSPWLTEQATFIEGNNIEINQNGDSITITAKHPTDVILGSGIDKYLPIWDGIDTLGTSIIFQTDSGNIGIGTESPAAKIHLKSTLSSDGILIEDVASDGIEIKSAGKYGIFIVEPNNIGIHVESAGHHAFYANIPFADGLNVRMAGRNGIYIDQPNDNGISIVNAGNEGINISNPSANGIIIDSPVQNGMKIIRASSKGLIIDNSIREALSIINCMASAIVIDNPADDGIELVDIGRRGIVIDSCANNGIKISKTGYDAISIFNSYEDGIDIRYPKNIGLVVWGSDSSALFLHSPGTDGIFLENPKRHGFNMTDIDSHGVRISETGKDGIYMEDVGRYGVYVRNPVRHSFYAFHPGEDGFRVRNAGNNGLTIDTAFAYGISIESTGDNAIQIRNPGNHGIYMFHPDSDGIYIYYPRDDGIQIDSAKVNGILIRNARQTGLNMSNLGDHGIYIANAGSCAVESRNVKFGYRVTNCTKTGFQVKNALMGLDIDSVYNAIIIDSTAHDAIIIDNAGNHAIRIDHPGSTGVYIFQPDFSGIEIWNPGRTGLIIAQPERHGIQILAPDTHGIQIISPKANGVFIYDSHEDGIYLVNSHTNAIKISAAGEDGINITTPLDDGVEVNSPGDDCFVCDGTPHALFRVSGDCKVFSHSFNNYIVDKTGKGFTAPISASTARWLEHIGESQLVDGECKIELPKQFIQSVTINSNNPMQVFLSPYGDIGRYTIERHDSYFIVRQIEGDPQAKFAYKVHAKIKHMENNKIESVALLEETD